MSNIRAANDRRARARAFVPVIRDIRNADAPLFLFFFFVFSFHADTPRERMQS